MPSTVPRRPTRASQTRSPTPPPHRSPMRWTHGESTYTLAEAGNDFAAKLKAESFGIVKILTDDAEIIGWLIRNDEDLQVRVLHCTGFQKKPWEANRRQKWRLDAVCRARITEMRRLD